MIQTKAIRAAGVAQYPRSEALTMSPRVIPEGNANRMKRTTEQVLEDAEIAACYLRSLLAKDVPLQAAIQLSSSYCQTLILAAMNSEAPKPPWEPGA